MKAIIKANNKEIEIELTTEQAESLGLVEKEKKKKTGWERGEKYYFISEFGDIREDEETNESIDDTCYKVANYFSTLEKTEEINKTQTLWRKMKRFADENNSKDFDPKGDIFKNYISLKDDFKDFEIIGMNCPCNLFGIYFETFEIAEKALELFGDELKEVYGIDS